MATPRGREHFDQVKKHNAFWQIRSKNLDNASPQGNYLKGVESTLATEDVWTSGCKSPEEEMILMAYIVGLVFVVVVFGLVKVQTPDRCYI